jgi:hypothetical protein
MTEILKNHSTIGCCGIDCGLCPRFHTKGDSACPGCGGLNFKEKHPSCGFITCCVIKNGLEVCSECKEYPCIRFDSEKNGFDSFVTHRKVFANLDFIRLNGMDKFMEQQRMRMDILKDFLENYDDGRSKSYFCLSCALLPLDSLQEIALLFHKQHDFATSKEMNRKLRDALQSVADRHGVSLKLNNKPKPK